MRVTGDGGVGIEVWVDGPEDGPPVLLMHGWPDTHDLWRHQVAALAEAGFRTIAPDLRGLGASDKPDDVDAYALKHTVVDMVRCSPPSGSTRRAWSPTTGARPPPGGSPRSCPTRSTGWPSCPSGTRPRSRTRASSSGCAAGTCCSSSSRASPSSGWPARVRRCSRVTPTPTRCGERLSEPGALTASLGWYRANAHPRTLVAEPMQLPPVTCPVLGVWSSNDVALTEKQMVDSAAFVEGPWRYERLDGPGHWMQVEAPEPTQPAAAGLPSYRCRLRRLGASPCASAAS